MRAAETARRKRWSTQRDLHTQAQMKELVAWGLARDRGASGNLRMIQTPAAVLASPYLALNPCVLLRRSGRAKGRSPAIYSGGGAGKIGRACHGLPSCKG